MMFDYTVTVEPLYKGHIILLFEVPKLHPIVLVHLVPQTEDNLSIKDKTDEFILSPTCPIFLYSTIVHSVLTPNREILV